MIAGFGATIGAGGVIGNGNGAGLSTEGASVTGAGGFAAMVFGGWGVFTATTSAATGLGVAGATTKGFTGASCFVSIFGWATSAAVGVADGDMIHQAMRPKTTTAAAAHTGQAELLLLSR